MKSIGDKVYWVESHTHYGKTIPCPMCFGKRYVTIILGDGSETSSECGMCSHGLDRATGQSKTWDATAIIHSGVISGISTREGCKYEVGYSSVYQHECFDSEEEARPTRDRKQKEAEELLDKWFKDSFIQCKKSQIWNAGYHRGQIKYHEQQIEWHKMRLGMCKENSSPQPEKEK
jgi:hypothetical protein